MIVYHKGSLFDAPGNAILGHACNCNGIWGAGIALEFKRRFFEEYLCHRKLCMDWSNKLAGTFSKHGRVVCLYTSRGFGKLVDRPDLILLFTEKCVNDLEQHSNISEIHIPKINSGLFKVPWDATAAILEKSNILFHVWEP